MQFIRDIYAAWLRRTVLVLQQSSNPLIQQSFTYDPASRLSTASDGNGNQASYSYLKRKGKRGQTRKGVKP
jgi:hypothetical protein